MIDKIKSRLTGLFSPGDSPGVRIGKKNKPNRQNRRTLKPDGTPVILAKNRGAAADRTDDNYMALLITNQTKYTANKVNYAVVIGDSETEYFSILAGDARPRYKIFNCRKNALTVTNISTSDDAVIRAAIYSFSHNPGKPLPADGNRHSLIQYQSAATALEENYYSLEVGAPQETSIFLVYTSGHPITYWVNSPKNVEKKYLKKTTNNSERISLGEKKWLYILNASPTSTSKGYITLTGLGDILLYINRRLR